MTNVIELAKQAGASRYTNRHYPDRPTHTFTVEQLELYTKLVRNAALEEAAQKCKQLEVAIDGGGNTYYRPADARQCVSAIESLKEPTP